MTLQQILSPELSPLVLLGRTKQSEHGVCGNHLLGKTMHRFMPRNNCRKLLDCVKYISTGSTIS